MNNPHGPSVLSTSTVALAALALFGACAGAHDSPKPAAPAEAVATKHKEQVTQLLESIESGDPGPVSVINPNKLIQHNLTEADGLAGLGAVLAKLPKGSARVHVVRVFADGDFVFTHTEYDFFGPKIGFDIFRFENDQIVEHWDNLQQTPTALNPSGRSMTDGPSQVEHPEQTEANKSFVTSFLNEVIIQGKSDKLGDYLQPDFHQHNPLEADGISGLGAFLSAQAAAGTPLKFDTVHAVYGEGEFVLSVSEGSFAGAHSAFYDLFRIEQGKIAEHWDTIETILPREQWQNQNGKF